MSVRTLLAATAVSAAVALPVLAQTVPSTNPTTGTVSAANSVTTSKFYSGTWLPTHWRASEAIGKPVYNRADERIGEIEELLMDGEGRVMAAVVGVGGFLGIGERDVAVAYRSFTMSRDKNGAPKLMVDLTKAELEKASEYKPQTSAPRS